MQPDTAGEYSGTIAMQCSSIADISFYVDFPGQIMLRDERFVTEKYMAHKVISYM